MIKYFVELNGKFVASSTSLKGAQNYIVRHALLYNPDNCIFILDTDGNEYDLPLDSVSEKVKKEWLENH